MNKKEVILKNKFKNYTFENLTAKEEEMILEAMEEYADEKVKGISLNNGVSRSVSIGQYRHLLLTLKSRLNAAQRSRKANDNNETDYHLGLAVKMILDEINLNN